MRTTGLDTSAHEASTAARPALAGLLALMTALGVGPAPLRAEVTLSGFGTLGGAISDQDFIYQRFIDDGGTLSRDSLLGLQLDADLGEAWRVTFQGKFAQSTDDMNAWEPTLSWAFLSWRPSNDLLLRAGKLRLPLMLYSANSDVGITYDFARLPIEVYSILPTSDVTGLSFAKTWLRGEREWTLEGYAGRAITEWHYYLREELPTVFSSGPLFIGFNIDMAGLVGSLRTGESRFSIGVHRAHVSREDSAPLPVSYPYVDLAPGLGYYQIGDTMPGPGVPSVDVLHMYVFTLGAEIALPRNYRLIGEYGRRRITNATMGPDTSSAYLALLKPIERWTPYVYLSYIRSSHAALQLWEDLSSSTLPSTIPSSGIINTSQRAAADLLTPYDQQSFAIGTSYRLSPTSKIKAEWTHTRTGHVSSFIFSPITEDSGDRQVNIFSLSYSVAF